MADQHPELPLDPDLPGEPSHGPRRPLPLHLSPTALLLVGLGGATGTAAREATGLAVPTVASWPLATLTVNLLGAFVLGVLLEALARRGPDTGRRRRLRLALGTGFCGGFTTYSALAVELDQLVRSSSIGTAVGYAAVTVVIGFVCSAAGIWVGARRIEPAR